MTDPNESAPAEATTETAVGSPVSLQAEIDVLDTINSAQLVFEAYTTGHLADLEAVATMGRAVQRKAHHALVARINRET